MPSRTTETDLDTALVALADQLRLNAAAIRGMAADASDGDTVDARLKQGLAADLDAAARTLDLLRAALCVSCTLLNVAERITIAAKKAASAADSASGAS